MNENFEHDNGWEFSSSKPKEWGEKFNLRLKYDICFKKSLSLSLPPFDSLFQSPTCDLSPPVDPCKW